jgi:archaellum biogenesis ATPase FlaH
MVDPADPIHGHHDVIHLAQRAEKVRAERERRADETAKAGGPIWSSTEAWDEAGIPKRKWVSKGYLIRGAVTVISGPGSAGKSMLTVAWGTALAMDCALGRLRTQGQNRVAIYNTEDDVDEQRRRFSSILGHLRLTPADLGDRLALIGPNGVGTLLERNRDGQFIRTEALDKLIEFVEAFKPDVLVLDPLVELHNAEENDNTALRAVLAELRALAVQYNMAVLVLHHSRKPLSVPTPGDPDTLRGASSIVGAARVVFTLNVMTEDESAAFNIPPAERRDYFRLDSAKSNYSRATEAEWFRRHARALSNGEEVPFAWPWNPPNPLKQASSQDLDAVLDAIAAGPGNGALYAKSKRGRGGGDRWAGNVVMAKLDCSEHQAKDIVGKWLDTGLLFEATFQHPKDGEKQGVKVNQNKRPGIGGSP